MIAGQLLLCLIALCIIVRLFYHRNIPLFLMAGVFMQWLSISIKIFYGAITGTSLHNIFSYYYSPDCIDTAFFLSIVGVIVYSLGVKASLPSYYKEWNFELVKSALLKKDSGRVIQFYLVYSLLFAVMWGFRFAIPGINTGIFALGFIKWGILTITILSVYYTRQNVGLLSAILFVEIILSLVSYFSDFKEYIYLLIILFGSLERQFSFGKILKFSIIGIVLFQVAIIWTTIKGEYRTYLSQGQRMQKVVVDKSSALSKLYDLSSNYSSNRKELDRATAHLIDRVGYISFFSMALEYVPAKRPHENGSVWLEAFRFTFLPRLFFPEKPVLDDSKHLNKYTGVGVAGADKGTSHSLGYMAESYVDFGAYGMFVPIFLLGVLTGYFYRYFLSKSYSYIWALIFIVPFFQLTDINGINVVKVIGNLFIYVIVAYLFNLFFVPQIDRYLSR